MPHDHTRSAPAVPTGAAASALARHRLAGQQGRRLWRSLDELAGSAEFAACLSREFPALMPLPEGLDRRGLLQAMAASLALAGLGGCGGTPDEDALPYVRQPEFLLPGQPKWYASAVTFAGYAQPLLGKTHVGRPVKLEGNPDHPASGGASDLFLQAALLGLYDPGRSQSPRRRGRPASWAALERALVDLAGDLDRRNGEGLALLTGRVTSPTLIRQIAALRVRWPAIRWYADEPLGEDRRIAASRQLFGQTLEPHFMLADAHVLVCLDDDPIGPGPRQTVHARDWAMRRQAFQRGEGDCALFVAEPVPSLTGARAQQRLVAPPARIGLLVQALAAALGVGGARAPALPAADRRWVARAAAALQAHHGRALVSVGSHYPLDLQVMALRLNIRLGAPGTTLRLTEPVAAAPGPATSDLARSVEDMVAGRVTSLLVLDANPVYAAPASLGVARAMAHVPWRLHAGRHVDETARLCHWHAPLAHELESWSDARAVDGTATIIQPLIRPFYDVRSVHHLLDRLAGNAGAADRDIVRETWRGAWENPSPETFERRWRESLAAGVVAGTNAGFVTPPAVPADQPAPPPAPVPPPPAIPAPLTLVIRPDPTIWDGRFADNAWLQETPKPMSKVTWGNVIAVSPELAARFGLVNGDEVTVTVPDDGRGPRRVTGPLWIAPGQEAHSVAVTLGYGRRHGGATADRHPGAGLGYDAFALLPPDGSRVVPGITLAATGRRLTVASTQAHQAMDGFDFVRTVDPSGPAPVHRTATAPIDAPRPPSFYPDRVWDSPSWGMAIDLDLCIGCNACVVACVAENNVPMVGKALVAQGREMHWLRVDHYFEGDPADPAHHFQPVPCMHCEQAPCEMGCPVNAAVHSSDGLNLQVYNRCIGTRTCSSFCPYKVRRFNWFDYTGKDPPAVQAARNPDVTVRDRGVMEKCTYCIQRISEARIAAKREGRAIRDGEVVPACQQACPTRAIRFGDITDAGTEVSRMKQSGRNYSLLEEANTRPRTTYLARLAGTDGEAGR